MSNATGAGEPSRAALARLEAAVRRDLEILNLPPRNWPAAQQSADGEPILDVAIVGAGMCGLTAAFALMLRGVRNIRLFDAAPAGREGPWITYARMHTLRSPKHLTGPDLGIPSLTYRAWHTAAYGEAAWETLGKILKEDWMAYLDWFRRTTALPVENGVAVGALEPGDRHVRLPLARTSGASTALARKVVLATGRGGSGGLRIPEIVDPALWPDRAAHTAEAIDFSALAGRRVAVLGGGASAFDNAAVALEEGAAAVELHVRRPFLPQVNKSRAIAYPGFQLGFAHLPDAEKWRLLAYTGDLQAPPPRETVLRALAHPGFSVHLGSRWRAATRDRDGVRVAIEGEAAARHFDFLIVGTGFAVDIAATPELAAVQEHVALWRDRYEPPADLARPDLGRFPYLGPGFDLLERTPGLCPALAAIHLFNYGATASHGALSGDIPGIATGAARLADAIAVDLFRADYATLRAEVEAFDEPELADTPFFVPAPARSARGF